VNAAPAVGRPADAKVVRLSSVVTPLDGGLYDALLPDFSAETGYAVDLLTGEDAYGKARAGLADVVLSHYGHHEIQAFMEDGLGAWPQMVFSNQLALLGPAGDPANVGGERDVVAAFERLAATRTPFVVNDTDGIRYLSEVLWEAAGRPEKGAWYLDQQARGPQAVAQAASSGGYTIWGLTPFLRTERSAPSGLKPIVLGDPLLQRVMVTVAVRADRIAGVNAAAALAFQDYLLAPRTQAMIRAVRVPGIAEQVWWPAGRNNSGETLSRM
jgi:tungstate transport system substrate-binding protein